MKNEEKRAKILNDAHFTLIQKLSYFRVKVTWNGVFQYVRLLDTLELYELYSTWSADEALKVSFSEQQEKRWRKQGYLRTYV